MAPPDETAQLMRFIAEKTKNVKYPMSVRGLAAQFKEEIGSLMSLRGVTARIENNRQRIHKMNEFDNDTKVKIMFALSAPIEKGFLNELKKQAEVEVDEKGKITNYSANDGRLELRGSHGKSSIRSSLYSNRWQKVCQKANGTESEEEGDEDANGQKDHEKKRIDLVRFLIERTRNATSPLNLKKLTMDYKEKYKCSESFNSIIFQIDDFRQRIHGINQFDMPTKVRMLLALSAPIDARFLKELQKDAIVELYENRRIKKYKANDGSLALEGAHRGWSRRKAGTAKDKKSKVVDDLSDSEEDGRDTDRSDEEGVGNTGGSMKSNQASASSSNRRSERIRKSTVSIKNNNKKRATTIQNQSGMSNVKKRTKISYTSSEGSEDEEESMTLEDDRSMDSEANNVDHMGDDFDYDATINNHYDESLEHKVTDPILGRDIETPEVRDDMREEEKTEEPSASTSVKIESMSLLELLTHLRHPILKYSPTLVSRIDESIKQLELEDQQVSFHLIIESLESCIQILSTPDEMDSDENTISLSDFYYHLGMAMCNIPHSTMDDFHLKMRKLATTGNKKVSMEHIRSAMGKTIDKILN